MPVVACTRWVWWVGHGCSGPWGWLIEDAVCPGMVGGRSSIERAMRPEGRRGDGGIQGERAAAAQRSVRHLMERRWALWGPPPLTKRQHKLVDRERRRAVPPHEGFKERASVQYSCSLKVQQTPCSWTVQRKYIHGGLGTLHSPHT